MKRLAVDIGGTFTDLVAFDDETARISLFKVLTTPDNQGNGVVNAIGESKVDLRNIASFVHGTTVGINIILEQKGALTALVTTSGFRDSYEIARLRRLEIYNPKYKKPKPLVPRFLRFEVNERTGPNGEIIKPPQRKQVLGTAKELEKLGVEAVAVCLLNSYANPAHELFVGEVLRKALPGVYIALSHVISNEWREYERASTTVTNSYIQPTVSKYLESLDKVLSAGGLRGDLLIMQSNGGLISSKEAQSTPIHMVESGPAGGVIASANLGALLKKSNLIAFDVGGTTAKASVIIDGAIQIVPEYSLLGLPLRTQVIDIVEVGKGGGSLAWVDEAGGLHVGPKSAGARPGPACYGNGGLEPTVTDADLLLGKLNKDYFLGGRIKLDTAAAKDAVDKIASRFGFDVVGAAKSIERIADSEMTGALRVVTIERGYDPKDFTLICFGGAGPVHAAALARELRIGTVIVPLAPALFSALGMLFSDLKHDYVQIFKSELNKVDFDKAVSSYLRMENEGIKKLQREGVKSADVTILRSMDLRYVGQEHVLNTMISLRDDQDVSMIGEEFQRAHEKRYTFRLNETPVEVVSLRVSLIGKTSKPTIGKAATAGAHSINDALKGKRNVYVDNNLESFLVFERSRLPFSCKLDAPCIIEEEGTSTVVLPNQSVSIDGYGNIIIDCSNE